MKIFDEIKIFFMYNSLNKIAKGGKNGFHKE